MHLTFAEIGLTTIVLAKVESEKNVQCTKKRRSVMQVMPTADNQPIGKYSAGAGKPNQLLFAKFARGIRGEYGIQIFDNSPIRRQVCRVVRNRVRGIFINLEFGKSRSDRGVEYF